MNKFEQARQKYKPANIKYLLIAETPPKMNSDRFFYFENVDTQDSLFLETMKCLYPEETENVDTKSIRSNKKYFLNKFKNDGFYLIDSLDNPFETKYTGKQKEVLLREGQIELVNKIKRLCPDDTKVILIASPVFKANYLFLKTKNINILNKELIDFPGSGGQKKFKEKIKLLLK